MIYAELIKRLRETSVDFGESDDVSVMMIEAANAIEDLWQALDTAQGVLAEQPSTWIPVTERLPETHDYVLCCGAKGGMFVGYISCFTEPQGFAWAWQHGGQGRRIKWWMPLPQPPKDGEP